VSIARVAAGLFHTCAVTTAGDAYCWGDNRGGQIGAPITTTSSATPLKVTGFTSKVVDIGLSLDHSHMGCALLEDKTVWCWGQNSFGALGRDPAADGTVGGVSYSSVPRPVLDAQQAPLGGVTSIGIGGVGGCVVRTGGSVWCWGGNQVGQLGNGSVDGNIHFTPAQVVLGLPNGVSSVSRKDFTVLALDPNGNVWAWGRNNYAAMGDGTVTGDASCSTCKTTPTNLSLTGVAQIAMGEANGFALMNDGTVRGWGENAAGNSGHEPNTAGDGACAPSTGAGTICNPTPTRVLALP
jgi:alpha-tubulin suppressor-like RCC1 family protein